MLAHAIDRILARIGIHIENGDFSAATSKCVGDFTAQDAGSARNGHGPAGEIVHPCELREIERYLLRNIEPVSSFKNRCVCHRASFPELRIEYRNLAKVRPVTLITSRERISNCISRR